MTKDVFIEVEAAQRNKYGEDICGDAFKTLKLPGEGRTIAVLSDGLGHGVKASILSLMTATMALKYTANDTDIVRAAEVIMDALPVCQVRKISYATFTVVDILSDGAARVIEMDNPPFLLVRGGQALDIPFEEMTSPRYNERVIRVYHLKMRHEDRLVFTSDGITQSGLGSDNLPLGWRNRGCRDFVLTQVAADSTISARSLSQHILGEALRQEPEHLAYDDMTAAVIYIRRPRRVMILTGPPYAADRDKEFAEQLDNFDGRKVICGGTTANIVARELGRVRSAPTCKASGDLPPAGEDGRCGPGHGRHSDPDAYGATVGKRQGEPKEKSPAAELL